jgi:hypothetical protein
VADLGPLYCLATSLSPSHLSPHHPRLPLPLSQSLTPVLGSGSLLGVSNLDILHTCKCRRESTKAGLGLAKNTVGLKLADPCFLGFELHLFRNQLIMASHLSGCSLLGKQNRSTDTQSLPQPSFCRAGQPICVRGGSSSCVSHCEYVAPEHGWASTNAPVLFILSPYRPRRQVLYFSSTNLGQLATVPTNV